MTNLALDLAAEAVPVEQGRFPDVAAIAAYTLAGRATLTLQSERTGAHYTFKVEVAKPLAGATSQPPTFVSLLVDGGAYLYLGILSRDGIRQTKKSAMPAEATPVRAFDFFWSHVASSKTPPALRVRHEGRCGRCARVLTHPSSLATGIGPECAGRLACD